MKDNFSVYIKSDKNADQIILTPSLHKQVDPSGCYDNLVTVRSFLPHYHLAGGVNLPKIIDCVGSDGKSRRQLVKVSCVFVCVSEVCF